MFFDVYVNLTQANNKKLQISQKVANIPKSW